uniref:MULE transposase domain-containing protein n=1 Tax=Panagrolaimus superbus TaxID=310955 RepID=A0A914YWZ9_9BILA
MLLPFFLSLFFYISFFINAIGENADFMGGGADDDLAEYGTLSKSSHVSSKEGYGFLLNFEGAIFKLDKKRQLKSGVVNFYWKCSTKDCKRRVTTNAVSDFNHKICAKSDTEHCHNVNGIVTAAKLARSEIANRARATNDRINEIVSNIQSALPAPVLIALKEKETLLRGARKVRNQANGHPADPASLGSLEIPDEYKFITMRDQNGGRDRESDFIVYDSGAADGENRFICFSCDTLLELLENSANWFIDATFKVTPKFTYQLLVIHAQWRNTHETIPCAYFLLNRKNQETYERAFEALKTLVNNSPETVMVDFEKALHNAIGQAYPTADISGCFFHFCQSIRRKLDELGLKVVLRENFQLATSMTMFRALAFLPAQYVVRAFVLLKNHLAANFEELPEYPQIQAFTEYFEETYVGRIARNNRAGPPLFERDLWNMHDRTIEGSPRTNNNVEGAHNKLHSFFNCDKPGFFKFADLLRKFLKTVETDVFNLRAAKPPKKLSDAWRLLEQRKQTALEMFDANDIIGFLQTMASILIRG